MSTRKRVLVVGGSGYLGQHVLQGFSFEIHGNTHSQFDLAFTHFSNPPPQALLGAFPNSLAFHVDLRTGQGFEAISTAFGQPDVVVNCAALSVPRACEVDLDAAMSINVPSSLVKWLLGFETNDTLLIHLSTDQVYEGVKSFYKEEDEAVPVNAYGKSKIAAEKFIYEKWSNFAILRSSIIFGPQTISPVPKSLPIQWMDSVLSKGTAIDFFHDEFRCPVYVKDVVSAIQALSEKWISECKPIQLLLNVGGPDRVSRVQMAETVADVRGHNKSLIKSVSASSVFILGGGSRMGGGGGGEHGGDFRSKVWSMSGGPYCRPKHWKRNTAIAMAGIFLVCIPIAMKSAELEQRPHHPVRPIPSQLWCKNFGNKDY